MTGPQHDAGLGGDAGPLPMYPVIEVDRDLAYDVEQLGKEQQGW
ncbi:hypothetical protein [Candidatus Laterigemmans baculatus]|nr:hypothetical protein [Candidatus Laterigemmans baculatus]